MNENNLSMAVVPQAWLNKVLTKLETVENVLIQKNKNIVNNQWLESTEARKMLRVSPKTWQTYRDERRIPFSQFGRKIYVKRADLEAFMEQHYICARNQKGGIA